MRHNLITDSVCLALLGAALLTGGCVETLQWTKNDAATSPADQQLASCTLDAERAKSPVEETGEARSERVAHWTSLCMQASGFKQTPSTP
jgi:hypothetical protein